MKTIEQKLNEEIDKIKIPHPDRYNDGKMVGFEQGFLKAITFAQRWIPCSEELPKILPKNKGGIIDNKDLLILKFKPHDSLEFGVLRELKNTKYWEIPDVGNYALDDVTHWRPIELT